MDINLLKTINGGTNGQRPGNKNMKNLNDEDIQIRVRQSFEMKFHELDVELGDVEEEWIKFRDSLLEIVKVECGAIVVGGYKGKATD